MKKLENPVQEAPRQWQASQGASCLVSRHLIWTQSHKVWLFIKPKCSPVISSIERARPFSFWKGQNFYFKILQSMGYIKRATKAKTSSMQAVASRKFQAWKCSQWYWNIKPWSWNGWNWVSIAIHFYTSRLPIWVQQDSFKIDNKGSLTQACVVIGWARIWTHNLTTQLQELMPIVPSRHHNVVFKVNTCTVHSIELGIKLHPYLLIMVQSDIDTYMTISDEFILSSLWPNHYS